ncbi:MAG: (2Fe-2S)-binding protein [Armatimonadota bacterium]|nr:(2Fe-2S)-binding protein [Armatimonadota bacterium]
MSQSRSRPRRAAREQRVRIALEVNGRRYVLEVPPQHTLLDVLRGHLGLLGTKESCREGVCGACTVLLDGRPVNACLLLGASAGGRAVTTVESLTEGDALHPLQQAFIECGAIQCGYCTPGMLLSAKALLATCPMPTDEEIRRGLSGNLCRCTGYHKIVEAVRLAASRMASGANRPAPDGGRAWER